MVASLNQKGLPFLSPICPMLAAPGGVSDALALWFSKLTSCTLALALLSHPQGWVSGSSGFPSLCSSSPFSDPKAACLGSSSPFPTPKELTLALPLSWAALAALPVVCRLTKKPLY